MTPTLSERLVAALGLASPPVALRFVDEVPAEYSSPSTPVPAGCAFWGLAANTALVTTADDHRFCSIGIHTHQLSDAPRQHANELETTLAAMAGLDYVRPEEVTSIPVMSKAHRAVVYAPLAKAEVPAPSLVLLFADAAQGLLLSEALSRVDGAAPPAMGRPACALVPHILNGSASASSLGCCGARAYLDALGDGVTVWGLLGAKLEAYVDALETLAAANKVLRRFHDLRRADIESGKAPSVEDSLARLS